jgi:hypothetical protein
MPADWWIPRLIIFFAVFFLLVAIRRRREAIRLRVRSVIIVESVYVEVIHLMIHAGRTVLESLLGGVVAALIVNQMIPARSRHIPAC